MKPLMASCVLTILFAPAMCFAQAKSETPTEEELKAAQTKVTDYLKSINGETARINPVKDETVGKTFPKFVFIAVLYPQFPVGRAAPKPLSVANVFAVPKGDGQAVPLTDVKQMEKFFIETAPKGKGSPNETTLKSWLRLSADLAQDGFYRFKDPEAGAAGGNSEGDAEYSGKIAVEPVGGNKGEITAHLVFKAHALTKIEHKVDLKPGVRPICQATKLLDPDPIVRRMAEDSIHVMGSAAKFYLDEQRAKAAPDLQKAIDRMWQRIVEEGR